MPSIGLKTPDPAIYSTICQFLAHEAMLLDENRLNEWVELVDEGILYEVPMRLVTGRGAKGEYPANSFRLRDDMPMILKRIERTTTGEGWAEDPPSRTVRSVSSIAVEFGDEPDVYRVHSALLIYRQRAQERNYDLIPARRRDLIKATAEGCKLMQRHIILAETILSTPNLGIFL